MKRKVKEKRLEICCLEMYSTSKCMESGTTINRGNENLFDDASFLPFPRFLGFHRDTLSGAVFVFLA